MMTRAAVDEYLLDNEDQTVAVHRHKILIAFPLSVAGVVCVAGLILAAAGVGGVLPLAAGLLAASWAWWRWVNWLSWWFVITGKRIIVARGVFEHEIGLMPLNRLTDMSYRETWIGQRLGWGKIIVESAGQDQALHVINFLPWSHELYMEISWLLFGEGDGT